MKIHGVEPEFARQMKKALGENLTAERLIDMHIRGEFPEPA
jgi:hypothetical protein